MSLETTGKVLLLVGIVIVLLGGLLLLFSRIPGFKNFGNLPGDVKIEGENFSCFAPIVSMLILSILLSIILNIIVRFFNK